MIDIPCRNFIHKGRKYKFDDNDRLLVEQSWGWKHVRDQDAVLAQIKLDVELEKELDERKTYGGVSHERVDAVEELLRERVMTSDEIANELNINPVTVRYCLKELKDDGTIAPNYYKFLG